MPLYQAQCILPFFTNLPEDVIVNRFHFFVGALDKPTAANQIAARLSTFYTAVYGSVGTDRANYIDWGLAKVKVFNLDDATPRIPEERPLGAFSAGTNATAVPTEAAAVLSWHAAPDSGVRFQRLYNRIYLGALTASWLTASAVDSFPILNGTKVNAVILAAQNLNTANTLDLAWRQVSNAGGVEVHRTISGGWMDNSPDTQRRRTVLASARNVFAMP